MRSSTGWVKNFRHVGQNGAFGGASAAKTPRSGASSPPRFGSRTNTHTTSAVTTPTAPSQMKAARQSYAAAIEAPNATPSACPMGGPKLNRPSAVPRVPGGK